MSSYYLVELSRDAQIELSKYVQTGKFFEEHVFYSERFVFLDDLIRKVDSVEAKNSYSLLQEAINQKIFTLIKVQEILSELEESNLQKERKDFWQWRIENKIFLLRALNLEKTLLLIEEINSLENEIEAEIEQDRHEKQLQQKTRQKNIFFLAVLTSILFFIIGLTIWQHNSSQNQLNIPQTVREESQKD